MMKCFKKKNSNTSLPNNYIFTPTYIWGWTLNDIYFVNQFTNLAFVYYTLPFISSLCYVYSISRVSLTYRVKSAHKVKLTDKQLLQWMVPILLVMLIYLGTWTLSATPTAEVVSIITIRSTLFSQFSIRFTVK